MRILAAAAVLLMLATASFAFVLWRPSEFEKNHIVARSVSEFDSAAGEAPQRTCAVYELRTGFINPLLPPGLCKKTPGGILYYEAP